MHSMKKMAKRGKKPFNFDSEVLEKIEVLAGYCVLYWNPPYYFI